MSCNGARVRTMWVAALAGAVMLAGCAAPEEGEPAAQETPDAAPEERVTEAAWTADASGIEEGGVFVRPARIGASPISDAPTGGFQIGEVIVTTVRTDVNSSEYTSASVPEQVLVALDAEDGEVRWTQPVTGALTCAEAEIDGLLPCLVGGDPHEPGTGMSPAPNPETELHYFRLTDGTVATTVPAASAREVAVHDGSVILAWQDPYEQLGRVATLTRGTVDDPESEWRQEYELAPECDTQVRGFWIEVADGLIFFRGEQAFVARVSDGSRVPDEALYSVANVPGHGFVADLCETEAASAVFTSAGDELARYERPSMVSVVSRSGAAAEPVYVVDGATVHDFATGEQLWQRDPRFFWVLALAGEVVLGSGSTPGGPTLGLDARTGEERWTAPFGEFGWVVGSADGEMITRGHNPSEIAGVGLDDGKRIWSVPVADVARVDLVDSAVLASTHQQLQLISAD